MRAFRAVSSIGSLLWKPMTSVTMTNCDGQKINLQFRRKHIAYVSLPNGAQLFCMAETACDKAPLVSGSPHTNRRVVDSLYHVLLDHVEAMLPSLSSAHEPGCLPLSLGLCYLGCVCGLNWVIQLQHLVLELLQGSASVAVSHHCAQVLVQRRSPGVRLLQLRHLR